MIFLNCEGTVVRGMDIVRKMENIKTGDSDVPVEPCVIEDCGQLNTLQYEDEDKYPDFPGSFFRSFCT